MAETNASDESLPLAERLRRAALFVLFGLVLLIPKTLALRRRRHLWNLLRLLAGIVGAVLSFSKTGGPVSFFSGLLLIFLALLARPAKEGKTVDAQARELGALVVLNGGQFYAADGKAVPTRLFVTTEAVHVLDWQHRALLEIPLAQVETLRATSEEGKRWKLVVQWRGGVVEFFYDGFFAEHLARVAETTLSSQLRRELPVLK